MTKRDIAPDLFKSVDQSDLRFCFKKRENRTNKGDYGNILCICGSYPSSEALGCAMSGAAYFSAAAALRTGAGLVRIFTHKENFSPISARLPEAVMLLYGDKPDFDLLARQIGCADAVLIGCGFGKSENSLKILETALENSRCPLVIDADGLNIIADNPRLWELLSPEQRSQTVITPHPKEFSRLCRQSVGTILDEPVLFAKAFSSGYGVITLLKDNHTVITDGKTVYINNSGNPGMATAGAGDVLSGILAGMLGNKALYARSALHKVAICAYLHGRAGDIAASKYGEHGMIASDIVNCICDAIISAG